MTGEHEPSGRDPKTEQADQLKQAEAEGKEPATCKPNTLGDTSLEEWRRRVNEALASPIFNCGLFP